MKIFSPPESSAPKEGAPVKKNVKGRKHAAVPEKQEVSDREIREKLASHVETSNSAKSQFIQKNSKALGAGFMNEDIKPKPLEEKVPGDIEEVVEKKEDGVKDSHLLLSDVKLNDPTDPNTQEKLKSVLRSGAFSFNPREKETLEKILSGN
ncbi:MAG: hypothetical protein H7281_07085 [Bacteriovorax sp.]|nr:hypothetical protein [Bacteriovorax sp.]